MSQKAGDLAGLVVPLCGAVPYSDLEGLQRHLDHDLRVLLADSRG